MHHAARVRLTQSILGTLLALCLATAAGAEEPVPEGVDDGGAYVYRGSPTGLSAAYDWAE